MLAKLLTAELLTVGGAERATWGKDTAVHSKTKLLSRKKKSSGGVFLLYTSYVA